MCADNGCATAKMRAQDVIVVCADCARAVPSLQARNRKDAAQQQDAKAGIKMLQQAGNSHDSCMQMNRKKVLTSSSLSHTT